MAEVDDPQISNPEPGRWARAVSLWILVLALVWAPFPLGSNREWSWSLLTLLTAVSWFFWALWAGANARTQMQNLRRLVFPLAVAFLALTWAVFQITPFAPAGWAHPLWSDTMNLLHRPVAGSISLNTWQTLCEISKLFTYLAFGWLIFSLARKRENAAIILDTIIIIGAVYAVYAFVLALLSLRQFSLFYALPEDSGFFSGPFVLHNSFATFEGLAAIATLARTGDRAGKTILIFSGLRAFFQTSLRFAFGSGRLLIIAAILSISALLASVSRGGFLAFLCALALLILTPAMKPRHGRARFFVISLVGLAVLISIMIWTNGAQMGGRFGELVEVGNNERIVFWHSALRMIGSSPYLGLGLGTFQDAYPMYADRFLPFILDKAHNDYLELAAGLGLPAAFLWWGAIGWCAVRVTAGYFGRRRDSVYALTALCATALVAVHSALDFSLQIPAVAITYTALLGAGLAQSYSSRS